MDRVLPQLNILLFPYSPRNDTSNTEEQIKTLNVDGKDLDISDIYPNIIEDPNNSNGFEQVSDPMLWSPKTVEYSVGYESDATTIVSLPVELEVEVEDSKEVSLSILNM